jgi:hypothetical protein
MVKSTKYEHCSRKQIARAGESGCLLEDDDGAMHLEDLLIFSAFSFGMPSLSTFSTDLTNVFT